MRKNLMLIFPTICLLTSQLGCNNVRPDDISATPDILIILTDDQGWGDLGINGNANIRTPNLDSLARSGARFSQFFVQPVCSPTRAEILTGRYSPGLGVYSTSAGGERMDPEVPTLGTVFQASGYRTGLFGKWHNGSQAPYHPNFRGFEEFYGFTSGHWAHYFSPELEHNGAFVRGHGFLADDLTNRVIAYMEHPDPRPFLAVLSYNTPHSPMQVPDRNWEEVKGRTLQLRHRDPEREDTVFTRAALAMVENIDDNVGRILNVLDDPGRKRETLVVFLSDNGPNSYRWNGGLKGRKGSTDEGGVRSPLLVRWPGRIDPGREVTSIAGSVDILPTLASLAGVTIAGVRELDGLDFSGNLLGTKDSIRPELVYNYWNGNISVRSQEFRLDADDRLYHLESDPGQTRDVSGKFPGMHDSLVQAKLRWLREEVPEEPVRKAFTLAHPEAGRTVLPARDATPHFPVQRSNQFPNASYMTNWSSAAGQVSWPVEVLSDGLHEVSLHYACTESAVGMKVGLWSGRDSVINTIDKAFDSQPYGHQHDRVARIESYAKDFHAMVLGRMELTKGPDTLRLRAGPFPQGSEIEVQRLVFRRLD